MKNLTKKINFFKIPISYQIKQMILEYMCKKASKSSGLIYWEDKEKILLNIPWEKYNIGIRYEKKHEPIHFDKEGNPVGWEGNSMIDEDPFNENRFLITEYDVGNLIDEMEEEKFIRQESSVEYHYRRIILQLKGKEFFNKGGYNRLHFFKKWLKENEIIITLIVAVIAIIISIIAL